MRNDIFKGLKALAKQWEEEDTASVEKFRKEGLMDLDNGAWNDIWPVVNYNPPCLKCKAKLRYNFGLDLFQCPRCGAWIFGGEYDYSNLPDYDDIDAIEKLYH